MKDLILQTPSNNIVLEVKQEGPQGLSVNWRGAYSSTTTYQINDAVYWNASSYICTAVTTGNLPSNTSYWGLMSSGMGDFSGPASSTTNNFVSFADESGKLGKDSGYNGNSFEPKNTNIQSHISSIDNPHGVTKAQVGLSNVKNLDQSNPENITQTASYRFVTDAEKSTWNAKQNAIGYTPENQANKKTTLTDSDTDYPTTKAVNTGLSGKENTIGYTTENVANKTTSIPTDGSSDTKYPSAKAVKDYADGLVVGLLDYRGAYDASGNTYPTTGGSGTAGAVLNGDMWIISVAGTLGGEAIQVGDSIIANVDTPGQTASNWNILNSNIGYVPENVANKVTSISSGSTDTQYPTAKLLYDQLALKLNLNQSSAQTLTASPIIDSLTASQLVATDDNKKLQSLAVATYPSLTELSYVKGSTSNIQSQINGKANYRPNLWLEAQVFN